MAIILHAVWTMNQNPNLKIAMEYVASLYFKVTVFVTIKITYVDVIGTVVIVAVWIVI
jgi:hypothetical protein